MLGESIGMHPSYLVLEGHLFTNDLQEPILLGFEAALYVFLRSLALSHL